MCSKWSPLLKQCFVTLGVSMNFMNHGLVTTFTSVLLPALRESKEIHMDQESADWIAAIQGVSAILATLTATWSIDRFGRKPAHIFSSVCMGIGWLIIFLSTNTTSLLFGRFIQGYSMGILAVLGSMVIGEYTSPKYRGALLATISTFIMSGVLLIHVLEMYMTWQYISLACLIYSFLDFIIILYSPESPSFLASCGRYDECRRVFHWLRGQNEDDELEKLIKDDSIKKATTVDDVNQRVTKRISNTLNHIKITLFKKVLVKPIIIGLHLYAMNLWSGAMTFDVYTRDIVDVAVGKTISFAIVINSISIQRLISSVIGIIVVKKLPRRLVLAVMMTVNVFGFLGIALYVYLKTHALIGNDYPLVGIVLLHVFTFSQSAGALVVSNIIPGEIFPRRYRVFCEIIGMLFFSVNEVIDLKSLPHLFSSIGVHGAFVIHAGIVTYTVVVLLIVMPETKDRTLLEIEEEFRGEPLIKTDALLESNLEYSKHKTENNS